MSVIRRHKSESKRAQERAQEQEQERERNQERERESAGGRAGNVAERMNSLFDTSFFGTSADEYENRRK